MPVKEERQIRNERNVKNKEGGSSQKPERPNPKADKTHFTK